MQRQHHGYQCCARAMAMGYEPHQGGGGRACFLVCMGMDRAACCACCGIKRIALLIFICVSVSTFYSFCILYLPNIDKQIVPVPVPGSPGPSQPGSAQCGCGCRQVLGGRAVVNKRMGTREHQ
jgi:hypothetical protein